MARRRLPAKSERASPCIISVECFIYSLSERNARVHLKFPCCNLMLYLCPKIHSRTSLRTMRSLCSWARRECSCNLFASTRFPFLSKTGLQHMMLLYRLGHRTGPSFCVLLCPSCPFGTHLGFQSDSLGPIWDPVGSLWGAVDVGEAISIRRPRTGAVCGVPSQILSSLLQTLS